MKAHNTVMLAVGLTAALAATTAFSQALISVDEFGGGTIGVSTLTWQTNIVEPFSGMATLSYNLPFLGNRGDVVIMDTYGAISDIIRFDGNSHLFFFSDVGPSDPPISLADVGVPAPNPGAPALLFGEVTLPSGAEGLFGYTPSIGGNDPGGTTAPVSYDFYSEVPEPSSFALVVCGLGAWGLTRCRRKLSRV
jgi:hypothetical protein